MKSSIFIISGPSGAGEDSVMEGLKNYLDIERIVNTTTRKIRPGEVQGNPYYFISEEDFLNKAKSGEFIEYAREYNNNLYGVTKKELERVVSLKKIGLWKMEYKGVMTAKKAFPGVIAILLTAPWEILEKRIRRRHSVSEEFVEERKSYTEEWMKHTSIYDYIVYNEEGKLGETIKKVAEIVKNNIRKSEKSN